MITTVAYPAYANNPPGISFLGRKTWDPGKGLQTFISAAFGVPLREQTEIVERIGSAMAKVGPQVREAMSEHRAFAEIGKRMLIAWEQGLGSLRSKRSYALGTITLGDAFSGFSDPRPTRQKREVIGRSELLAKR